MSEDNWNGHERRTGRERRVNHDRREEIRFEPGKSDRRKGHGRRKGELDIWDHRDS